MTQEEKKLLLKDLSARLPYGVICYGVTKDTDEDGNYIDEGVTDILYELHSYKCCYGLVGLMNECDIESIKPYLRPISSMTDEEMDILFDILQVDKDGKDEDWIKINDVCGIKFFFPTGKWIENVAEAYDYLYSIHIDFRGLIRKGLAIEAPEGMYNIK